MHPTAVLNVVGLTPALMGEDTPNLNRLARDGASATLSTITPAVTCSVQATFLTGTLPSHHGIVGNGWYFRDEAQVMFWKQPNILVQAEKVWETARRRDPSLTAANICWWFNMYSSVDWSVTPRPVYRADGGKILDIYTAPADLRSRLTAALGRPFPFFNFWGPQSNIESSRWIAEATALVDEWHHPSLLLAYLPHLDYNLQRLGPNDPAIRADVRAIDAVCGTLIEALRSRGRRIIVVSEYGIVPVSGPVHLNVMLREQGLLAVRDEVGTDAFDAGASDAFAVADHQVAHVHVRNPSSIPAVRRLVEALPGVERVYAGEERAAIGLDHPRAGELVAIAQPDKWFTYYYWLDERRAPDYARTVDIHRKPGYDPVELFVDPSIRFPTLKAGLTLARKTLGFRYLMEMIALDASLVRGSHGRITDRPEDGPLVLSSQPGSVSGTVPATGVRDLILSHLFD
jgi:predicted AlkP superfamily pyrophosphatase or phosphodiesterase